MKREIILQDEIWREVEGFPSYMVSNKGRVKTLRKEYYCGNHHSLRVEEEHQISPTTIKGGYKRVLLSKDGKRKAFLVHRLVALAFIPNPNNYKEVNHKDETTDNNVVENLEWCNPSYNINYGSRNTKAGNSIKKCWERRKQNAV